MHSSDPSAWRSNAKIPLHAAPTQLRDRERAWRRMLAAMTGWTPPVPGPTSGRAGANQRPHSTKGVYDDEQSNRCGRARQDRLPGGRLRRAGGDHRTSALTWPQFERFWENRTSCRVLMEACGSAHHWGRWLMARGFDVVLLPTYSVVRPGGGGPVFSESLCCPDAGALAGTHVCSEESNTEQLPIGFRCRSEFRYHSNRR
jgi:hypothetical protein